LWRGGPCTLHPAPCTLNPVSCTLHPEPCTMHPQPCTLHPQPSTFNPANSTRHPSPGTLHPAPCTLQPQPYTLNPAPWGGRGALHPAPSTLNPVPCRGAGHGVTTTTRPAAAVGAAGETIVGWARKRYRLHAQITSNQFVAIQGREIFLIPMLARKRHHLLVPLSLVLSSLELGDTKVYAP
jgi:hypothetical protein